MRMGYACHKVVKIYSYLLTVKCKFDRFREIHSLFWIKLGVGSAVYASERVLQTFSGRNI